MLTEVQRSVRSLPGACGELEALRRMVNDQSPLAEIRVLGDWTCTCFAAEKGEWHYRLWSLYRIFGLNHNSCQKVRASLTLGQRGSAAWIPMLMLHPSKK